jgi:DNA-binding winged helix-turn-helix (wHTH) protein
MANVPRLKALRGEFVGGRTSILLDRASLRLGRDPAQNDVALPARDSSISRQHMELIREGDTWVLVDHSTHGVYVNGALIKGERCELQNGDRITVGQSVELLFDAPQPASIVRERQSPRSPISQHLDPETLIVWRDGLLLDIKWSQPEFELLRLLYQRHGQLCRYDEIIEAVWGSDPKPQRKRKHVQDLISQVRKKLEPDPAHPVYLVTRPGLGYVLVASPEVKF